jgi:predicted extracellular nuclease
VPRRSLRRRPSRSVAALAATAFAVTGLATSVPGAGAAPPTTPFVAELHYDNAGTDAGELVEVELPPGTSSEGWSIVLYNGAGGVTYDTDSLPAVTAPADASAVALLNYPSNGLQNGSPDGLALVRPDLTVAEFLSYEGTITATNGPAVGLTSTDIGVAELGTEVVGNTLMRRYDPDTDSVVWRPSAPGTPGAVNPPLEGEVDPCDVPVTHEVGAVQGSGFSTPIITEVTVAGVVVADVPLLGGFYLQDADGDGDAATSDGIFVASAASVGLGDGVAVTGAPAENFGETRITATGVGVCTPAPSDPLTALPAAAPLDLPSGAAEREPLEGMLVAPVDVLTVSEVFALTRFGELTLSEGGLLVQPTELARPGTPEAEAVATGNALRHLILDDGSNASTSATNRPYLAEAPVRVGDELTFTSPVVLGFGFGSWRLQPADGTPLGTFAPHDTRPEVATPDPVGGDITIAAFNVLNYFVTFGPPGRGAANVAEFELQADKIVTAILALDADIVTLMEIEDTNSTGYDGGSGNADLALAELVDRLNAEAGAGTYAYSPFPDELLALDRDVIRSAIIYRPASVTPVGDSVGLVDESVWFNAREPIAQTFEAQGDVFTVVANHFKSKSPGGGTGDNADTGQGEWNGDRVRQANSLAAFVAQLQADTGDSDVLLMGDFNAYTQEDPIEALRVAGYTDLGSQFDPERYSYVFDELSGSLDHGMASASFLAKVTDAVHWNINAVESFAYQYTGDPLLYETDQFRSSDHDPLLIGIDLATPTVSIADAAPVTEGGTATFTVSLSAPTAIETVTVAVTTVPGSATEGADYTATSTTATFAPGATTATVTVPTLGDTLDELDETFTATLGAVTGPATVGDGSGTATIVDDDPSPTVRALDALVVEGNTGTRVVRVPVRLSTASGRTVTVAWSTQALTASAGSDFVAATGTVTFTPGQMQGFAEVQVVGDRRLEFPELFRVRLSSPSGATVAGNPALVLILDDDLFR